MRNSFNTAAFSEVAHETRDDPTEAWFSYEAAASATPRRGLSACIRPALLGTVKSSRRFTVDLVETDTVDNQAADPTPIDLALTGVAACSLITLIGGGSARGIVFDTAEMRIAHDETGKVSCDFDISGPAHHGAVAELLGKVRHLSPNHRTLTELVPLTVSCGDSLRDVGTSQPSACPAGRRVRWVSGAQFESLPIDGDRTSALRVDQPKQLTGVDWGPNPQEYLLMGLAADLASRLRRLWFEETGHDLDWEVVVTGSVDIRGLLQVDPTVPVHLQALGCVVHPPDAVPAGPPLLAVTSRAVAESVVCDLIRRPHPVDVSIAAQ